MEKTDYRIEGMTMAITNMKKMLDFYSNIFGIYFTEKAMFGSKLYSGVWGGLNLLFCPAELAGNSATQNRHQFDIIVPDLQKIVKLITNHGGEKMGEIVEDDTSWSIGIYDPDRNSILFKELK